MKWRSFFNLSSIFAVLFGSFFLLILGQVNISKSKALIDTGYEMTPQFFRFVSFGHWPAAVDYLWITVLQEIGTQPFPFEKLEETQRFYRLMQQLDPEFFESYDQGAIGFMALFKNADAALEVLDRGIFQFEAGRIPASFAERAYLLYIYRAYVFGYMKNDFERARKDYLLAEKAPGSPVYLKTMKEWLSKPGSDRELGRRMLKILSSNTKDPDLKQMYEEKLKSL